MYFTGGVSAYDAIIKLQVDGTTVEPTRARMSNTGRNFADYEFKNIGHKVVATKALHLEVTTLGTGAEVEGFIQAIEVPTGENPVIYTRA